MIQKLTILWMKDNENNEGNDDGSNAPMCPKYFNTLKLSEKF